MKKQKIRIMVLLFLLFAVMLLILSFTNFNYSKKPGGANEYGAGTADIPRL